MASMPGPGRPGNGVAGAILDLNEDDPSEFPVGETSFHAHERMATSLLKAFTILEALGSDPEVALSEVSRRTGIGKGTVHRVLTTLATQGYVEQSSANRTYRLGVRLFHLGSRAVAKRGVRSVALEQMKRLSEETSELVNLGVPSGDGIVVIERQEGSQVVQMRSGVGDLLPLETTSLGRAYLATLPIREVQMRYPDLVDELEQTRRRGFAIDDCNFQPDLRCTGAPIFDVAGKVVALIGISTPAYRITLEQLESELGPRVRAAAEHIRVALGGQPMPG